MNRKVRIAIVVGGVIYLNYALKCASRRATLAASDKRVEMLLQMAEDYNTAKTNHEFERMVRDAFYQ